MSEQIRTDQLRAIELGVSELVVISEHPLERQYKGTLINGQSRYVLFRRYQEEADLERARLYVKNQEKAGGIAILRLYQWKEFRNEDESVDLCLVFSSYRASLISDITSRTCGQSPRHYDEQQIISQLFMVVAVLCELEKQEIAHRNITPFSLYITNTGFKLGEIGQSRPEVTRARLNDGEVYYLSPVKRDIAKSKKLLIPNPFRSDVFSLGVAVLMMVLLRRPKFDDLTTLQSDIDEEIKQARASTGMKEVLKAMLTYEERRRPNFVQLEEMFAKIRMSMPMSYNQPQPAPPSQEDFNRLDVTIPRYRPEEEKKDKRQAAVTKAQERTDDTPQQSDVRCMFCSTLNIVEPESQSKFERPVRLFCNPEHHLFCSRKCFTCFAQLCTSGWKDPINVLKCRECKIPIDSFFTVEALGGPMQYGQLRQDPMKINCVYCKNGTGEHIMSCTHVYCKPCLEMLMNLEGDFVPCGVCEAPIMKSEIKEKLPGLLGRVFSFFR